MLYKRRKYMSSTDIKYEIADVENLNATLEKCLRISSYPVGIKMARDGEKIEQKVRYPLRDIGNRLAVCQGVNIARTYGWAIAFRKEDHGCPGAFHYFGYVPPEIYQQGFTASLYAENLEIAKKLEASHPTMPMGSVSEIWIAPLASCKFDPDVAVVYGTPGQIVTLIQAANFYKGTGVLSRGMGRAACASWLAGTVQSNECTSVIPGGGEKVFGGTQDHEMVFSIPRSKFKEIAYALEQIRKNVFRFPIPVFGYKAEPVFPESYKQFMPWLK
jgi:uncharacterized protein (DUF169 family)